MNTIAIPAGDSRCLDYCYALQQQGATVIGASSLGSDSSAVFYDQFEHLPWLEQRVLQPGRDFTSVHQRFIANLLPYLYGNINYLKMTSEEALPCYLSGDPVRSPELGETHYQGQINCLHIDGNHDYAHVTFDIEQWSSLLTPNAWLIIDDYRWAHGDGPRRAADDWLLTHRDRIGISFFAGGALFIQLKNTS